MSGADAWPEGALTRDAFLGGRVSAWQPRDGYRAGVDPVLLAASVPARAGDQVLELGCGVGVASLCLAVRVGGLRLFGIERQPQYAELARRNGGAAQIDLTVHTADLAALPPALRAMSFDHVFANPPYFEAGDGTRAQDQGRETAMREETPLSAWIDTARARLKPKGWLTLIQSIARLPDCLAHLSEGFGSISALPLAARAGRAPSRVLIRARKGGRAPFVLLPALALHAGDKHEQDGEDFTDLARAILRDGAALPWQDRAKSTGI